MKLGNSRTGASSRSGGTATKWEALPMSIPAALGWVIVRAGSGLARLEAGFRVALYHCRSIIWLECGAASGTSSCSVSQTGYRPGGREPPCRFTNIDDVTQDHVIAGRTHHCLIGLPQRRIPPCHTAAAPCFFGTICGSGADYHALKKHHPSDGFVMRFQIGCGAATSFMPSFSARLASCRRTRSR